MTDTTLHRRYRRLLLAYPGRYRRTHGAEILTTLLEMSGDKSARPPAAEAWHLLLGGVRQRFRLPSGRPLALVAAVLIALIGGGFGAAAGSWLAEQTFTGLPGDATVAALTRQVAGGGNDFSMDRSASPWFTETVFGVVDKPGWTAPDARDRLASGGWHLEGVRDMGGGAGTRGTQFDATRDGLLMRVTGYVSADHGTVSIMLWPADTGALKPLMLVGLIAGLIAGWLVAAAGAYRSRGTAAVRRRVGAVLTGLAVVALAVPAFAFYINVMRVLQASGWVVNTVHSALNASPYWSYSTPWMLLQLTAAGAGLAGAAWLVMGRRGTAEPTAVPTAG